VVGRILGKSRLTALASRTIFTNTNTTGTSKKTKVTSAIQMITDAIVADQLCCIGTIERRLQQADGSGIS
jgi:hypothetical protein